MLAAAAVSAEDLKPVDVPAGDLIAALKTFAKQTGVEVVYRTDRLQGMTTHGVTGTLTPVEAAKKLLEGTAFTVSMDESTGALLIATSASRTSVDAEPMVLAEIVVTGSNIVSSVEAEQRSVPVDVITAEDISKTGATSLAEVLANNPALAGGALAEQQSGGRGFANLRGLGPQYTLVLLNGRRLSANDPTNILSIPAEAVERVEILKSGASAIYGSDAVAGVINVILKSSADGMHASVSYGDTTQGGGQTTDVNVYGGTQSDTSRFFFLLNHMTRGDIGMRDRDITATSDKRAFGGYDERSQFGNPGRIGGVNGFGDLIADSTRVPRGSYSLNPSDYRAYDPDADLFDTNALGNPSAIAGTERLTVLSNFEQDFLDGRASFFMTGFFWQMKEKAYLAPLGLSFSDPEIGPIPASNPYNPFGQEISDLDYVPLELGRRLQETPAHTYRISGGLRGEVGQWRLESALSWFRNEFTNELPNSIIKSALRTAINRPGATAFNPFCNQCNTAEQFAGLLTTSGTEIGFSSDAVDFRASGPLFALPTGLVRAAVGAEHRREGVSLTPDSLTQIGGTVGSYPGGAYEYKRTIRSLFAEVQVPLLPAAGRAESPLELTVAARSEDYSDFGSETSPLASLRYSFLDGQVTLRASYAKAFLAPYLELATYDYFGTFTDFLIDPVTQQPTQTLVVYSGTPEIEPERSTTKGFGIILTPHAVPGLTVTLDGYRIEQTDFTAFDPQASLDGTAPGVVNARGNDVGPGGEDIILTAYYYNLDHRATEGYEASVNYELPELAAGRFIVDLGLSRLTKFEVFGIVPGELVDLAGKYDPTAGSTRTPALPKTRGSLALSWERGAWSASSQLSYMSGYRETEARAIGSYSTTNFQVGYTLGKTSAQAWLPVEAIQLTLGVQNAFDRDVPFLTVVNDYNKYENDLRGRFVYARVGVDF
ncbi:MAG: TonB-dependent receptor [Steroidobacter sp.]|nr:TonB-dependent receptor [Steroidobacter sp.]